LKGKAQIKLVFCICLFAYTQQCFGQLKSRQFAATSDTIVLDSIPISSFSLILKSHGIQLNSGIDYRLSDRNRKLILLDANKWDSLLVSYMRYPDWLVAEKNHRKPVISSDISAENINTVNNGNAFGYNGNQVSTDGVLLRGISFGNAQDLVLNSSLNLRVNGKISPQISIEAAVTDQEFPFQPEGTTTSLQDFDRIYVLLKMPKLNVLLGDHAFNSPRRLLFMKYAKKDRGLALSGTDSMAKGFLNWEFSAALARGRFFRNEINGIEGLQGPYRLKGSRGEQFVVIISGTEAVYLDGKKMERGLQSDYVMDYNSGEITFMPKHLINTFSRIVVEFQYSDRAYTRSVTGANISLVQKKWEFITAVYSEQDAKNQPIQQDLLAVDSTTGKTAKELLQISGDNLMQATVTSAHVIPIFSISNPNYILGDSAGTKYFIYISNADTHKIFYNVAFTYLGAGLGHYILKGTVANGKAYLYVGEVNGTPAGDYEPLTQLQAPGRISMAETSAKFKPRAGISYGVNLAVSSNEKNLFSALDDADNDGSALHFSMANFRQLGGKDSLQKWSMKTYADVEHTSKNFSTIERYRDVEFGRQWNRSLYNPENGTDPRGTNYVKAGFDFARGKSFNVYTHGGANQTNRRNSIFGNSGFNVKIGNFFLQPIAEFSKANLAIGNNLFYRGSSDLGYKQKYFQAVYNFQKEQSVFNNNLGEYLPQSYGYLQHSAEFVFNKNNRTANFRISERLNQDISNFVLIQSVRAQNISADFTIVAKKMGNFKLGTTLRKMELLDTLFKTKYANENQFASRIEYNFNQILKLFGGSVYYQTQSGREQQRQYSYFEVPAGQGFFAWIDFNKDSVQQVNEFQETPFKDQARYVRLLVPTGNYIKSQSTEFNGNLLFHPGLDKPDRKAKFTNRTTWNYSGKSTVSNIFQRIAPFTQNSENMGLISMNGFIRNQAEIELFNDKFVIQHTFLDRSSKSFFTSGFDTRKTISQIFFFRYLQGSKWQFKNTMERKQSSYNSQFIPLNGFAYLRWAMEPTATWQPSARFRVSSITKFIADDDDTAKISRLTELGLQFTKSIGKGGIMDVKVSTLNAKYYLKNGTPLSYDVLQGFSPGQNFRGTIDLRFSASKNIQMVISYEGRKTATSKLIHVGRAEARYLF